MATKRVTLTKSNGTTSYFDFTIPEVEGTYNLKLTLDSKESKTQTVSGTGIAQTIQGSTLKIYAYYYSVNIGTGATNVKITGNISIGTTPANTVSYNSSTGIASGTIYSAKSACSATLSWQAPKVIDAGNIVVNGNANTYRLSLGLSNGTTINAGTFTTPVITPPENFSITTPSFTFYVTTQAMPGFPIYNGSGTSSTVTYTAKDTPSSVVLNGVTLTSTDTKIGTFSIGGTSTGTAVPQGTATVYAKVVGKIISVYTQASGTCANATATMNVTAQTYSGVINY